MKLLNVLRYALLGGTVLLAVTLILAREAGYSSLEFIPNQPITVCLLGLATTIVHAVYSTRRRSVGKA